MPKVLQLLSLKLLFLVCLLVFLKPSNTFAQIGLYDLRFNLKSVDCATKRAVIEVQIKSSAADFILGDSNIRFKINTTEVSAPTLLSQVNFSSASPASNSDYSTQNVSTSGGSNISLNITYSQNNSGSSTPSFVVNTWKTIAELRFPIQAANTTGTINLTWLKSTNTPATSIGEIEITDNLDPAAFNLLSANEGSYTNFSASVLPTIPIVSANSVSLCVGATLNMSSSSTVGATYSWAGVNGFSANIQSPTRVISSIADDGLYSVTASLNACTATNTISVAVTSGSTATITSNSPICLGNTLNLTANNAASYAWSGPNAFTSTLQNPVITNPNASNQGIYSLSITAINGCAASATASVSLISIGTIVASSNSPICAGNTLNLAVPNANAYAWSGPNGFSAILQNPTINNASAMQAGNYSVTITAGACSASATIPVVVNPLPIATASSNSPICAGLAINLAASAGTAFAWNGPNAFSANTQNISISNASTAASGIYSLSVTDANNCTNSNTIAVTINNATATITSNSPICLGNTLNLTANNAASYAWSGPNAFTSTLQNPVITNPNASNQGIYSLSITAINGCAASATASVSLISIGTIVASSNSPICAGNTLNLAVPNANAYAWSGPNGFSAILQNPTINNASAMQAGNYSVTITAGACSASATIPVVVNPLPIATASSNSPICAGLAINLAASAGTAFAWNGPNAFSANTQNISISNASTAASGIYSLSVTDANNCTNSNTIAVTINNATATITSNSPICLGNTLNLTANNAASYAWSGPNAFTSTLQNPVITNPNASNQGIYSLSITAINGCAASATASVSLISIGTIVASSNSPICAGNTLNLAVPNANAYAWSGPNGFSAILQNPTINNASAMQAGNYSVTITAGACSASATIPVVVNPLPIATASSNSPICAGLAINLAASAGTAFAWNGPNAFSANTQNISISNASTAASGIYSLSVTDANNCTNSNTIAVTINNATATITSNSPICLGNTLNLTANNAASYAWSGPNAFTSTLQNPVITNPNASNQGIYSLSITAINGCAASATASVSLISIGTIVASSNSPICAGNTLNLAVPNANAYAWSGPNGFSAILQNPTINNASAMQAGNYSVTITAGACSASATIPVVVNPLPIATASSNSPICAGLAINLAASAGTAFAWNGPNAFSANTQNISISNASTAASGIYSLSVTDANNCTNSNTIAVTINNATATITSNSPICLGNTLNLTANNAASYAWSGPNAFTSTLQNPVITNPNASNQGIYSLSITAINGCAASATASVSLISIGTIVASSNSPICAGNTLNLAVPNANAYAWSGPNGFSAILQNPTINNASAMQAGNYSVTITAGACSASATIPVVVNPLPIATASSNSPICAGLAINLAASAGTAFAWNGPNAFSANTQNISISNASTAASGIYSLSVTDANNCTNSNTIAVTINNANATITSNSPICLGNTLNLTANNAASYAWSGPNAFTSTLQNPVITNPSASNQGIYSLSITAINGCAASATASVSLISIGTIVASSNSPICAGNTLNLAVPNANAYAWSGPNGFSAILQNPTINNASAMQAGNYSVTITAGACSASATIPVVVNPLPIATASSNSPICAGLAINLAASAGTAFAWNGPNAFSANTQNISISNASTAASGIYTLQISDGICSNSITTPVQVTNISNALASSNSPVCEGASLNLSASGGALYSWSSSTGYTSTLQNPQFSISTALLSGTYSVTILQGGCSTSLSVPVIIANSGVTISTNAPACVGNPLYLSASLGGNYLWNGPNGFIATSRDPLLTASSDIVGIYSVTVEGNIGCTGTASIYISVIDMPAPEITMSQNVCAGETLFLSVSDMNNYRWAGPAGFISSVSSPSIANISTANEGTYLLSVTAGICSTITSTVFSLRQAPSAILSGGANIVQGQSTTLTISFSGIGPWSYTLSDGSVGSNISTNPYTITVAPNQTTIYSLTSVSDACTGAISGSAIVSVYAALPTPKTADLSLGIAASKTSVTIGDLIEISITVQNDGPDDASNVKIGYVLPNIFEYVSSANTLTSTNTASGGRTSATTTLVSGTAPVIQSGNTYIFIFKVRIIGFVLQNNRAEITFADQPDPDSTPNNNNIIFEDDSASLVLTILGCSEPKCIPFTIEKIN